MGRVVDDGSCRRRFRLVPSRAERYVFLTICARYPRGDELCRLDRGRQLLTTVVHREALGHWRCHAAVVMPDHMHLLVWIPDVHQLAQVVRAWKRYTARHLHIHWRSGFFDRCLRWHESLRPAIDYIRQNPVRAGLVTRPEDWPYLWVR